MFNRKVRSSLLVLSLLAPLGCASSAAGSRAPATETSGSEDASYAEVLELFRTSESGKFFEGCYGYAVFPTVAKGGFAVGASYGKGRAFVDQRHVGDTQLKELSLGWQIGGQAFSQIIFFEDQRAFEEFSSGGFEFGATAQAVAVTAGVEASSTTGGSSARASGSSANVANVGGYHKGFAVFTLAKGGLMVAAALAGQKYSYTAVEAE
ncbi:MAG: YSC84-related protein [Myxococcota bacterium]